MHENGTTAFQPISNINNATTVLASTVATTTTPTLQSTTPFATFAVNGVLDHSTMLPADLVWTDNGSSLYYTIGTASLEQTGFNNITTQLVNNDALQSFNRVGQFLMNILVARMNSWISTMKGKQTLLDSMKSSNTLQFDMWEKRLQASQAPSNSKYISRYW